MSLEWRGVHLNVGVGQVGSGPLWILIYKIKFSFIFYIK